MENEPYRLLKELVQEVSRRTEDTLKRYSESTEQRLRDFREEFDEIKTLTEDTNRQAHLSKHNTTNIDIRWGQFVELLEKRDKRDAEISKTVHQMHEEMTVFIQERRSHAEWIKQMQELGTMDSYKKLFADVEKNTDFRRKFGSIGWVLGGIGTFVAVVYALKDLLVLFFDFLFDKK